MQEQLAVSDKNANVERPQALVQSGEHAGEERYKACFLKSHKCWVVKSISQKKITNIYQPCLHKFLSGVRPVMLLQNHYLLYFPATLLQNQHYQRKI